MNEPISTYSGPKFYQCPSERVDSFVKVDEVVLLNILANMIIRKVPRNFTHFPQSEGRPGEKEIASIHQSDNDKLRQKFKFMKSNRVSSRPSLAFKVISKSSNTEHIAQQSEMISFQYVTVTESFFFIFFVRFSFTTIGRTGIWGF